MKKLILIAAFAAAPAFASTTKSALIANNTEVKALIAAFEQNRGLKCNEINDENTVIKKGAVKTTISCSQYDQNGEPQANVTIITFSGHIYDNTFFQLAKVVFTPME